MEIKLPKQEGDHSPTSRGAVRKHCC